MKVTKLENSCLDILEGNNRLVVDPGIFTKSLTDFANVTAVVITHVHPDHLDEDKIKQILSLNPDVKIFATQEVSDVVNSSSVVVPEVDKEYAVGAFTLEFFGGDHAIIHPDFPRFQNFGVLVNGKIYQPGDSFTPCPKPHDYLCIPIMAPWAKFSESADFATQDPAKTLIPIHNAFVNEDGQALYDRIFGIVSEQTKKNYHFMAPGDSIDI